MRLPSELRQCQFIETSIREAAASELVLNGCNLENAAKQYPFGCVCADVWIANGFELSIRRAHYTDTAHTATLQVKFLQETRQDFDRYALDLALQWPDGGLSIGPWQFHYFVMRLAGRRSMRIV